MRAFRLIEDGQPLPEKFSDFKDKIWILGTSAPGLHDFKPTPLGPRTPGVYLHITGLINRIQRDLIQPIHPLLQWTLYALMCLTLMVIVLKVRTPTMAVFSASLFLVSGSLCIGLACWVLNVWLSPLWLATGNLVTGICIFSIRFQSEWKERGKLAKSIENSMSSQMVQLIRDGQVKVSRFGERRTVTILFSDLSGFTTLAEKLPPDLLVKILNSYFDQVVELIFKNHGYVDKFIGDAVMAIWGAPVASNEPRKDVEHALQTVLEFQSAVDKANDLARQYLPEAQLAARVGLHTGSVIVGNIGSEKRHNYTAIGDAVNLASRLEGLGKQYNCYNLISDEVFRVFDKSPHQLYKNLLEVDTVMVKGKSEPTVIYTFLDPAKIAEIPAYASALALYRQGLWWEALTEWGKCVNISCASIMRERCQNAIANGQPKQWRNGAWAHDEK